MNWPNEPTGTSPLAVWLKRLLQSCKASELKPGIGYLVTESGNGKTMVIRPGGSGSGSVGMYLLKSAQDDYLTCHSWDGTTEGGTNVYIAKPYKLRCSLASVVEPSGGTTYSLTYATGLDTNNKKRTKAGGGTTEDEYVTPIWTVNDVIYAISVPTGVLDGSGSPISLLSIGDSRQWAVVV